jgi:hypothetical protein
VTQRTHENTHKTPRLSAISAPTLKTTAQDLIIQDTVSNIIFPEEFEDEFAFDQIKKGGRHYSLRDGADIPLPKEMYRRRADPTLTPQDAVEAALHRESFTLRPAPPTPFVNFEDLEPASTDGPSLRAATAAPVDDDLQALRDKWNHSIEDLVGPIPAELPPMREINHRIPLIDEGKSYRYHRPRCPDVLQRLLMDKINKYTTAGWWEAKTTEQAAPLLCLLKKNGKLRTVMDLRQRNDNTVHDLTPMPDQDRIRNDVARAAVRSKLDMSDAYEQVRVEPADIHKTVFSSIYGTFRSHVMQQGDCNAPATFQRLMTHIFRDYIGDFVHVYLDDIFIYSKTVEDHERHLSLVFTALRRARLYLSKEKVNLYAQRMECLGHIIDDEGIHADEDKMTRVRDWPTPRNHEDVMRFLGLVQYLAHFMPDVSAYTGPLASICEDKTPFYWRPLHDKCFSLIKALTCKSPVLKPISFDNPEPVWLVCDASVSGVGAYYGQGPDWKTCRPAGFMSRKFTNAQRIYATYEHETLAILEALHKWEDKLIGRKFTVSDHKSLERFKTQPSLSPRQHRWIEYFSRFDLELVHVPGDENVVADALSRMYVGQPDTLAPGPMNFVTVDATLDPDGDDLTNLRRSELVMMNALRTAALLPEELEDRDEEAHELRAHSSALPREEEPSSADAHLDPTAFESAAAPDADPRPLLFEPATGWLEQVKAAYEHDKFFKKVIADIKAHPTFLLRDGLIWSRNQYDREVLCLPHATVDGRTVREVTIDTAHRSIGHFGSLKTLDHIRRWYWWPRIGTDVDSFCASCPTCQTTKSRNTKPAGKLHGLPIPDRPWQSIAMDFLGPFPPSDDKDYLWVIIDRYTSLVHLVPITTRTTASELAYIFVREIVRLHGLPESIVSDRDSKFTSKFWREVHRLLGVKLLMSTAFHPQTDGATERANRSVSQVLRTMVRYDQLDWARHVPLAEFAINSCRSESTGYAPFELTYGYVPLMLATFNMEDMPQGVRDFAENARQSLIRAHDSIIESRVNQAYYANNRRSDEPKILEGSKVYLSTTDLNLPKSRARKLAPRFIGPFLVLKANPRTSTYTLELPPSLTQRRIHPTFHVSRLRLFVESDDTLFPGRELASAYDFGQPTDAEFTVREITAHKWIRGSLEFTVTWDMGDTTTEPLEHVQDLHALDEYLRLNGVSAVEEPAKPDPPARAPAKRRSRRR